MPSEMASLISWGVVFGSCSGCQCCGQLVGVGLSAFETKNTQSIPAPAVVDFVAVEVDVDVDMVFL